MAYGICAAVCLSACKGSAAKGKIGLYPLFAAIDGSQLSGIPDAVLLYYLFIFYGCGILFTETMDDFRRQKQRCRQRHLAAA